MATVRLSPLQRQALAWLWRQQYLVEDRTAPNYPALVRRLATPPATTAAAVQDSVQDLAQKRLVTVGQTPDGQIQRVVLTEAGWDCACRL
jgi:hypothetical protein